MRLAFTGPQGPAHAVAATFRDWYRDQGRDADRLLVPSFVLGDPWTTMNAGLVPYWTFFGVKPALDALDAHLSHTAAYREVRVMIFQHGALSPGRADPDAWRSMIERHGSRCHFVALDEHRSPRDIAAMARYGAALSRLAADGVPWHTQSVATAVTALERHADSRRHRT